MKTDTEVQIMLRERRKGKTQEQAAARAGMHPNTARKYEQRGALPSQLQEPRTYRTRPNPFAVDWPWVQAQLERDHALQADTLFAALCRAHPDRYQPGQIRTLQRHIALWRAQHGPDQEVMFAQIHHPGRRAESDFTHMTDLAITLAAQPFPHLVYHLVLTYSNQEAIQICFSERFESLAEGVEVCLWQLGGVPEEHRTDNLSAAVHQLDSDGRKDFTARYTGLMAHYGMRPTTNQAGVAHENGDVEQAHARFKRAVDQALLRRLAVFADGWTVAAAEAICADLLSTSQTALNVLDGLAALLDASLIVEATNGAGEPRCTMLETIREYAQAQLVAHGELAHAQALHARWIAALADGAKQALTGAEGALWTARLTAEHGNLHAALRWAINQGDPGTALRIGRGVWRFWWRCGFAREGLEWLTLALTSDHAADAQVRAEALRAAGVLAWAIADNPQAHRWLAQGLKLAQGLPDRQPEAAIYSILGIVARSEGAFAQACIAFELARTISAALADPYATRFAIMGLAEIDMRLGKLNEAAERYATCIALNSAAGDADCAQTLEALAVSLARAGDHGGRCSW